MKKQFDFRKMSFYQIWIRSFCDGNGDGIGDLYGVYDRLDYIRSLGVDGIWFSPIFPSPNADYGYDISDYKNIHPDYGDLDQFKKVLDRAHALGLKVLLDLVINHTSDEHPWFLESRKGGEDNPYRDYYIWRDPLFKKPAGRSRRSGPLPPNNWFSQFEGIAWEYCEERGQYYLHIFARKQPDLNMDNPRVREEVKEIMRFWLDMGVDGFREDVINFISKVQDLAGGPVRTISGLSMGEGSSGHDGPARGISDCCEGGGPAGGRRPAGGLLIRRSQKRKDLPDGLSFLPAINGLPFYKDGPNLHRYLSEFREVAREYGALQIGEAPFTGVKKARSYVAGRSRVLDMVIQFDTMMADCFFTEYVHHPFSLRKLKRAFDRWQYGLAGQGWNALYLENHDHPRVIDRYGSRKFWRESGTMLAAAYIFQRGTPFLYQGQELGMTNIALDSIDKYLDVASINAYHTFHLGESVEKRLHRIHVSSRDSARTPVQWSAGPGAGFTDGTPWFSINPNYTTVNAEAEEKDPASILHFYRRCLALRKRSRTLLKGNYRDLAPWSRRLYMYARSLRGETILILCSFSAKPFSCRIPAGLAGRERKLLLDNYGTETGRPDGSAPPAGRRVRLRPYEVQVWRFPASSEPAKRRKKSVGR